MARRRVMSCTFWGADVHGGDVFAGLLHRAGGGAELEFFVLDDVGVLPIEERWASLSVDREDVERLAALLLGDVPGLLELDDDNIAWILVSKRPEDARRGDDDDDENERDRHRPDAGWMVIETGSDDHSPFRLQFHDQAERDNLADGLRAFLRDHPPPADE